ncbi:MAG: hypothetical protein GY719_04950 [bacterium]|nr:hypothetical protein [bacterium]
MSWVAGVGRPVVSEAGIAAVPPEPLPSDREELLAAVGKHKASIYLMVRTTLDDLEAVAPWEGLYYPPTGTEEFLSMETALVAMIEDIPQRVESLTRELLDETADDDTREAGENLEFYFQGIQMSVSSELEKLKRNLDGYRATVAPQPLSGEQRAFSCEISADLKGKYTSSIMGAAASLIAERRWNGVEIEPLLFPEKAEEFDRNERLVETLSEVTESISGFLELVPLLDLVASWKLHRRVDQYALAPLYTLLGNLGMLMQVSSRRALYSGDYHQIQRRETLLSTRFNELTTLHNMTWGTVPDAGRLEAEAVYPAMVQKATELAAVLHIELLKKIIGEKSVKDLLVIVTMEKEDEASGLSLGDERRKSRRRRVAEELRPLIPLLYDEDLKTFLELLLGSVLKRASLAIQRESLAQPELKVVRPDEMPPAGEAAAVEPAAPETAAELLAPLPEDLTDSSLEPPGLDSPTPGVDAGSARLEALRALHEVLQPLLSRTGAHRKSFELVRRLLKQQRSIPTGLLDSMRPYLHDLMNSLIPKMHEDGELGDLYNNYGEKLLEQCQVLCDPSLHVGSWGADVPGAMEKVLDLLNRLAIVTRGSIESLSTELEASSPSF